MSVSTQKTRDNMAIARAALAQKRAREKELQAEKMIPPKVQEPIEFIPQNQAFEPMVEEEMEMESEEAKIPSLPPTKKRKRDTNQKPVEQTPRREPPRKKTKKHEVSVEEDSEDLSSDVGSPEASFGRIFLHGMADAFPKLLVMVAGFGVTFALQALANSRNHIQPIPEPFIIPKDTAIVSSPSGPNHHTPVVDTGFGHPGDIPSFISHR